ncbi:actin or actin-binding cytoskeletal protein [Lithospermum erythrorhizon]|uniref:Actin or actin-binding cytoskeletal protein n=1 Tax=Lithospermum erythrorhizon TaxID=34254 RepID=A0AAV3QNP7_LITER
MDGTRGNASPQSGGQYHNDSALEGVAANVKLLLKLINDHKASCHKEKNDGRRMLRVATMMTILDNIRSRIQKCQTFGKRIPSEEVQGEGSSPLKQCHIQEEHGVEDEEKEKLRRELNAGLAARKSLEIMCSSLGREKEIIAAELAMKVHQLNETDELINDLKEQNEALLKKLRDCASDNKEKTRSVNNVVETQENMALQERNKMLSAQLLRSLDGYRSMKRRYKETKEENIIMSASMEEILMKIRAGLDHIHDFKGCLGSYDDVQDQIINLEHMFESLELQVAKYEKKKGLK